jgi:uncharacterized protein YndB with AHSA1/START domain
MKNELIARAEVTIDAPARKVWDGLTKPELVKKYFFGTDLRTDWVVGQPIVFTGEWEGKSYEDHGHVMEFKPFSLIRYNYWSSFSGKEDKAENYANITYSLREENGKTHLEITQDHVQDEKTKEHSENNWKMVLNSLKELLEDKSKVNAF